MPGGAFVPWPLKLYPPVAGVVSGIGSALLTVAFWQALIIATITGFLTLIGTILAAVLSARINRRSVEPIRRDVAHVKRQVSEQAARAPGCRMAYCSYPACPDPCPGLPRE